jgi:hypothetical protein
MVAKNPSVDRTQEGLIFAVSSRRRQIGQKEMIVDSG